MLTLMRRERTTKGPPGHAHQFTSTTAARLTLCRSICRSTLCVVAGIITGLLAIPAPSDAFHRCGQGRRGICRTKVRGYSCTKRRFNQTSVSLDGAVACTRGRVLIRHTYRQNT